jgi:hypothetical protein
MFSNFNANDLTIVVGLIGVLASAALSYLFYALGRRSEQAELSNQISTLQSALLASLGEASAKYRSESAGRQPAADVIAADHPGQAKVLKRAPQAEDLRADSEVTELVRGYLALLVNHKGEVEMSALLRQVSEALGARRGLIGSALSQLAAQNVISADPGQDIVNARIIYLRPPLPPATTSSDN